MSDCNCNSAPGQHKDDYTYHADNCPFFLYGRIAELEQQVEALKKALLAAMEWNWLDDDAPPRFEVDNLPDFCIKKRSPEYRDTDQGLETL